MRSVLMVAVLLSGLPALVAAQENAVVERVVSASPEVDGKAYSLALVLQDGRQLSLQIRPADAAKIVDGLSKLAGAGAERQQLVVVVQGVSIQADPQGRFVVLQPRSNAGPLQALAIPLEGVDRFLQLFQQKADEAKVNATDRDAKGRPQREPRGAAPQQ
jgi:hypothetical protein